MRLAIWALLVAVSYFLGVHAGFALTLEHTPVALLWPPNALLLAALLLSPKQAWPVLIAAALPAHVLAEMSAQVPLAMVLCWFVSNVAEALIGAVLVRYCLHRSPRFDRFRDLVVFLLCAPLLGTLLSSFLDAGFVAAIGWRYSDFWAVWRMRLLSNVLATLMLVPLIVHLAQTGGRLTRQHGVRHIMEIAVLLVGLWGVSALVFLRAHAAPDDVMRLYMPLPFLIWAAMRLSISGVCLCVVSVAAFAISGSLQGRGPFASGDVMGLQVFLIIATVSLLLQSVSLSELHHAQRIAVRRGERLQLALIAARMGIWDWEVGSPRMSWSSSSNDFAGRELQSETTLRGMLERVHPDDRPAVSAAFANVRNGADHLEVEFRRLGRNNLDVEQAWIAAIGKVSQSNGRRILGVHMDVSERKQQDLQLHQQREQLFHLSRVAMLGELSGALAHELSQPLTAILANAQAARNRLLQTPAGDVREIVEDIIVDNKRAAEVIRRLRDLFTRRASETVPLDINECVHDVLSIAHGDLVARNVTAQTQLERNLPDVWADRVQLQQVLLNLLHNACDAMGANGPGERNLRVATLLTETGDVAVEVSDRGTGIDDVEKIFEPFFTTKQHGLGLGLAICRTIVVAHQGRLWATNNPQGGATLHVVLPVESLTGERGDSPTATVARYGEIL